MEIVNVPYEKVGFNATELSKLSYEEFKKHEGHHFAGDPKAEDKLKEAYALIQEAVPQEKPLTVTMAKPADKPMQTTIIP